MKLVEKLSVEEMLELGKEIVAGQEVGNAKHLDKLPLKVWEKILDELDENDLFPLAMSCRYFRQKQKELVARTKQHRPRSRLALKTNLRRIVRKGQPVSADYLQFCSKDKVPRDVRWRRDEIIRELAAFHGYLPLLQELLAGSDSLDAQIVESAGESSSSRSLRLLLYFGF